jgi:hypothetical protein
LPCEFHNGVGFVLRPVSAAIVTPTSVGHSFHSTGRNVRPQLRQQPAAHAAHRQIATVCLFIAPNTGEIAFCSALAPAHFSFWITLVKLSRGSLIGGNFVSGISGYVEFWQKKHQNECNVCFFFKFELN